MVFWVQIKLRYIIEKGFYPEDFDKWLGLSTINWRPSEFNHYLYVWGPQIAKAGLDVLDLLVDSYSKDDGSYYFRSTQENCSKSTWHSKS